MPGSRASGCAIWRVGAASVPEAATSWHRSSGGRIRRPLDDGERDEPGRKQPFRALPVLLVVDVEALVSLGEERRDDPALARPRLGDDARPRDLERAVLRVHGRQRLVLTG